jgi:hypothetical protein
MGSNVRNRSLLGVLGLALILALALSSLLAPVDAGDNDVYVRIVQVKATGERKDTHAEMDKALEPFRQHLEEASKHAKYSLLGKSVVKKGSFGSAVGFDLENHYKAVATPSVGTEKHIKLVLKVNKHEEKKEELVFEATLDMKDAATAIQQIDKALEGADLLLAVTASRDSL